MKSFRALLLLLVLSACTSQVPDIMREPGVSAELAEFRNSMLDNVVYNLHFSIPENKDEAIAGSAQIDFDLSSRLRTPLLFDFQVPPEYLEAVSVNGKALPPLIENGHISIPGRLLVKGRNSIEFTFRAGELSLNRSEEFMYTLFVPDRASTSFPGLDQPDIKAKFLLKLRIPDQWTAISNNQVVSETSEAGLKEISFGDGPEISTYLFAFAAGKFERIVKNIGGIEMEMIHREPLKEVVERNGDAIFQLHYNSIRWMEEYTGIAYPFAKFGFALIPSFQYGGMEHPGTIYYRASSLFLEESPTVNEQMSRASLIAHETSHIWFGDLVTMKWFDDVWLKEVFAGYMSDKIVNPDFPQVNHELRFLLSRYPAAYAVDRTRGANPIIQNLDNLKNAGSLYGGIIYNKAPIVMKHLEHMTGDSLLRESLRVYLTRFSYGNAVWDDLIGIIENVSGLELKSWSNVWVREPGMPRITAVTEKTDEKYMVSYTSTDAWGKNRIWPQTLNTHIITDNGIYTGSIIPGKERSFVESASKPLSIIPDTLGLAYGFFEMDSSTVNYFTEGSGYPDNSLFRGIMWLNMNENMLNGIIDPEIMYKAVLKSLTTENDELVLNHLIGRTGSIFWNFLDESSREKWGFETEQIVWQAMIKENDLGLQRTWFNLFRSVALTNEAIDKLYTIWNKGMVTPELKLSEDDMCTLSLVLALKGHGSAEEIIARQQGQIKNADRRSRYNFVLPSVSSDLDVKDEFFASLSNPDNREKEPWVLEALGYLHHPINSPNSIKYIRPSLDLLEEIKTTGDIFFPASWISTTLGGHSSAEALSIVEGFLKDNPDYPEDLILKIYQAADHLYRVAGEK